MFILVVETEFILTVKVNMYSKVLRYSLSVLQRKNVEFTAISGNVVILAILFMPFLSYYNWIMFEVDHPGTSVTEIPTNKQHEYQAVAIGLIL